MTGGALRQILVPNGVMHYAPTIFLDCFSKPRGGVTISGTKLKDRSRVDHTRKLITIITTDRTDNRKISFLGVFFHFLYFRLTRRDKSCKVFLYRLIIDFAHLLSFFKQ